MHNGKYLPVPKRLSHVGGTVGAIPPHQQALVDPLFDLCHGLLRFFGIDGRIPILINYQNAVVPQHPGEVIGIPAADPHTVALGGPVCIYNCRLAQESVHFIPCFRKLDSLLICDGLIVKPAHSRDRPGQAVLTSVPGVHVAHADLADVGSISRNIGIQIFYHTVLSEHLNLRRMDGKYIRKPVPRNVGRQNLLQNLPHSSLIRHVYRDIGVLLLKFIHQLIKIIPVHLL